MKGFKQATTTPDTKKGLSSLSWVEWPEVNSRIGIWLWGRTGRGNEQGASERGVFFSPSVELYRNAFSVGLSIRPESITTFRRVHHTFALRESQLAWVQDREGSYRQLANMGRETI